MVRHLIGFQTEVASVVQPAARLSAELRISFEQQIGEQRGFHLGRLLNDSASAQKSYDAYREARTAELALYAALEPLARQISAAAVMRLDSLHAISHRWHTRDEALLAGEMTLAEYTPQLPLQRALQDSAQAVLTRLEQDVELAYALSATATQTLLRRDRTLALALGVLALLAAAGVAWTARSAHLLARALARSVEEEVRLRDESERRREELEHVTTSRARLIRGFSHDVKNPLGAADGYLALLEDGIMGGLEPKQNESISKARVLIRNALGLIQDLLELARAETGNVSLEIVGVDIARVTRETTDQFRAQAEAGGLRMETQTDDTPLLLQTDAARARQVLSNLLSNAVKYTSEGTVRVMVEHVTNGDAPRPGIWVAIRVADTGPGIPADKQRFLFQEFTRFQPGASQGAGIGLAISRHLARALGGDITFRSEEGKGSTFTFWLPGDAASTDSTDAA